MYIGRDAFSPQTDREAARALFRRSVGRVEIETHSYCNRRCEYCPNVIGDRLGENVRMPESMYLRIVRDLGEIGYSGTIVLTGYNEPLADRIVVDRIAQARAACGKASIELYTNGDYLDPDYLAALAAAGLSYLHISIHVKPGDSYSGKYAIERMFEVCVRIGIAAKIDSIRASEWVYARVPYRGMKIDMRAVNFTAKNPSVQRGTNRGGLIDSIEVRGIRTDPCHFVFGHFNIGYTGNIMPCCNLRSDRPEHAAYRIGNIEDFASIYQAFAGSAATEWRRSLAGCDAKAKPCDTCTSPFLGDAAARERLRLLSAGFEQPAGNDSPQMVTGRSSPNGPMESRRVVDPAHEKRT
jgi:MoaA/NifB/PqqE/SkfB family radical SAM enzyme